MIHVCTTVLVCTAALGSLVFVTRYLRTRWFTSPVGRQVMGFMLVCLLLFSLAVVRQLAGPEWTGREPVRLVSYILINAVVWWQVVLLFTGQNRTRRPRRDGRGVR